MALGAASLQGTVPATQEWLQVTRQDVRVDKSCSWVQREQGAVAVQLRDVPIPLAETFRQLGVEVAIGGSRVTGPVLSQRREAERSALHPLPHLSTYERRERAISTLVTPLALHAVAVVSVTDPDRRGLETAVMRALWGATRLSRAKEIVFTVLSKGHRISPVMHMRYERLLWLARVARRPGVTKVFTQAIWDQAACRPGQARWGTRSTRRPPRGGAHARAGGGTCRDKNTHPLHFVHQASRHIQHRVRDNPRCHSSRQLEARRPITFGGLGDGADSPTRRAALRTASTGLDQSLLRGLMAGALWTAARVSGHGTWTNFACPLCGGAHADEFYFQRPKRGSLVASCQFGGLLDTFCPQKLLQWLLIVP